MKIQLWSIVLMAAAVHGVPRRPDYVDCVNSAECFKEQCCTIGSGRFTIPLCRLRKDIGEPCRPGQEAVSTNVSYPDGATVTLTEVYHISCPCSFGLQCDPLSMTCQDPTHQDDFNLLNF